MSTVNKISITFAYSDANKRTYSITLPHQTLDAAVGTYITEKVQALKTAAQTANSNVRKTFVSEEGNPVIDIATASIITTQEEVIY